MTARFLIVVANREGGWNKVQTIRFDRHQKERVFRNRRGAPTFNRAAARDEAVKALAAWDASGHFGDRPLSVIEVSD